jgi:serine/threonine-protein kinase
LEEAGMNPYLNRVMIQDPKHFFGRRAEVRRILARLGADRPQSISVVGERRIGKSSLLKYLTCPEVQDRHMVDRSSLAIVFLDFQQLRTISVEQFFDFLLVRIGQVSGEASAQGPHGYAAFQGLLETFRSRNRKLVLLLDEFQAITTNTAFNIEFYSFLRSMANNYAVAYVTSSSVDLQRLCCSSDISDSPFFNIFSNLYLRTFERDEALELITRPSEENGAPLRAYADEIIRLAGLFPFYLQIACSIYYDSLRGDPAQELNREEIKNQFLEEAGPHFEYFWEHAAPECQSLLENLAHDRQPEPAEAHVCQSLLRKGYLAQEGERWKLFSAAFGEHIRVAESAAAQKVRMFTPSASTSNYPIGPGVRVLQYQIQRKAGEGGMGVVFQAEDTALGRKVALKFVKPAMVQDDMSRRRFLQEARSAAGLNHPAIASVYELFEYGPHLGLALEWIEGTTLKQRMLRDGRIPLGQAVVWMCEALDGLGEAHAHGIVHRDINCANLMLTAQDHVKIMDFGLAHSRGAALDKTLTAITAAGALMGTIDYMSPEQARGIPVDSRSDLFSLGVVFFEALTGELPFRGESAIDTLQLIAHKPAPSVRSYGIERAEAVDRLLQKLLSKSTDQRHGSAAQLKADFEKLLED